MKSERNMSSLIYNNLTEIEPRHMKIGNLCDKEFKITVSRKLNEVSENSKRQFNKIGKRIHKQNEKFNKEMEIIKKKQRNSGAE